MLKDVVYQNFWFQHTKSKLQRTSQLHRKHYGQGMNVLIGNDGEGITQSEQVDAFIKGKENKIKWEKKYKIKVSWKRGKRRKHMKKRREAAGGISAPESHGSANENQGYWKGRKRHWVMGTQKPVGNIVILYSFKFSLLLGSNPLSEQQTSNVLMMEESPSKKKKKIPSPKGLFFLLMDTNPEQVFYVPQTGWRSLS